MTPTAQLEPEVRATVVPASAPAPLEVCRMCAGAGENVYIPSDEIEKHYRRHHPQYVKVRL